MPSRPNKIPRRSEIPVIPAILLPSLNPKPPHFSDPATGGKAFLGAASLTVESALALPVFFVSVTALLLVLGLIGQFAEKSLALSNKARTLAMYGSVMGEMAPEWIDLKTEAEYHFPVKILPIGDISVPVRARVRTWKGADPEKPLSSDAGEEMVYVTDNNSVYHTHADCTHLDLTILVTTTDRVGSLRNSSGERYKKCKDFPAGYSGTVYVTEDGEYYYPSADYPSLTRHVRLVSLSDIPDLKKCERCAARDAS